MATAASCESNRTPIMLLDISQKSLGRIHFNRGKVEPGSLESASLEFWSIDLAPGSRYKQFVLTELALMIPKRDDSPCKVYFLFNWDKPRIVTFLMAATWLNSAQTISFIKLIDKLYQKILRRSDPEGPEPSLPFEGENNIIDPLLDLIKRAEGNHMETLADVEGNFHTWLDKQVKRLESPQQVGSS